MILELQLPWTYFDKTFIYLFGLGNNTSERVTAGLVQKYSIVHSANVKNQWLPRYCVAWKSVYNCKDKLLTAGSLATMWQVMFFVSSFKCFMSSLIYLYNLQTISLQTWHLFFFSVRFEYCTWSHNFTIPHIMFYRSFFQNLFKT